MSDYLVKIIPVEPENKITMEAAEAITKRIHESIKSDTVEFKSEGTPFFVDCGSNLDEIKCPICGEVLDLGWWGGSHGRSRGKWLFGFIRYASMLRSKKFTK